MATISTNTGGRSRLGCWAFGAAVALALALAGRPASAAAEDVYVTNHQAGTVSVIDTASKRVLNTIAVGGNPEQIAITPDGHTAYITHQYSRDLSAIDTATGRVSSIPLGSNSWAIAITPDGRTAYVTRFLGVSVLDVATNRVTASFDLGFDPDAIAIAPDGTFAYFTYYSQSGNSGAVGSIDTRTNQLTGTAFPPIYPYGIVIGPDSQTAYVTHNGANSVSVLDLQTGQTVGAPIGVGTEPLAVALSSNARSAYVVNHRSSTVSALDLRSRQPAGAAIPVGTGPVGIVIDPQGTTTYPRVRVRCPGKAAGGCAIRLQAVSGKHGRKVASAIAWARLGRGKASLVTLRPKRTFWGRLATARRTLIRETVTIGHYKRTRLRWVRLIH